jgi:hypothetical protein
LKPDFFDYTLIGEIPASKANAQRFSEKNDFVSIGSLLQDPLLSSLIMLYLREP